MNRKEDEAIEGPASSSSQHRALYQAARPDTLGPTSPAHTGGKSVVLTEGLVLEPSLPCRQKAWLDIGHPASTQMTAHQQRRGVLQGHDETRTLTLHLGTKSTVDAHLHSRRRDVLPQRRVYCDAWPHPQQAAHQHSKTSRRPRAGVLALELRPLLQITQRKRNTEQAPLHKTTEHGRRGELLVPTPHECSGPPARKQWEDPRHVCYSIVKTCHNIHCKFYFLCREAHVPSHLRHSYPPLSFFWTCLSAETNANVGSLV